MRKERFKVKSLKVIKFLKVIKVKSLKVTEAQSMLNPTPKCEHALSTIRGTTQLNGRIAKKIEEVKRKKESLQRGGTSRKQKWQENIESIGKYRN